MRKQDVFPLGALGFLLLATAGWWALALWPVAGAAPEWLERTRAVCFNTTETGLPDTSGWILLVGQSPGMLAFLMLGWGRQVRESVAHLLGSLRGRVVAGATLLLVVGGLGAAGVRVANARIPEPVLPGSADVPESYPRLDREAPDMSALVDQNGQAFSSEALGGRSAFVTFAFGNCKTVCPMVVHASRAARMELEDPDDWSVVVVTLDPWRDTPSRLSHLMEQYELDPDRDFVLSGEVADVERALDGWNIARSRDTKTGDITHPPLVYLVEPEGTVAYASSGAMQQLAALARRLR